MNNLFFAQLKKELFVAITERESGKFSIEVQKFEGFQAL